MNVERFTVCNVERFTVNVEEFIVSPHLCIIVLMRHRSYRAKVVNSLIKKYTNLFERANRSLINLCQIKEGRGNGQSKNGDVLSVL